MGLLVTARPPPRAVRYKALLHGWTGRCHLSFKRAGMLTTRNTTARVKSSF